MSQITTRILPCGMPLIVESMPAVRSAALCWTTPAGSAHDPENLQGLSTMLAELLMRGAGKLGSREHADALDRLGASRGTDIDSYSLRITATTLGSRLAEVLPLMTDMVRAPRLEAAAIEPTRDLALQALASVNDEPQERAMLLLRSRHHPAPRNRSGLGTEDGLKAITRKDLVDWWSAMARPGSCIFAVAGAVDAGAIEDTLNALLAGWSGATPEPTTGPPPPRGYYHEHDETNQVQIMLAFDAPPEPSDDSILERIAMHVLAGGMGGRLFTEVREKRGLCYAVSASYRSDRDFGVTSGYVGTTPERAQDSLDVLIAELQRITTPQGAVTAEEFARAKIGMKSGIIFSGESTAARAGALAGDYRKLGRPRTLDEVAARVEGVTLDRLNDYLSRRTMGSVTIQTLGPKELRSPLG